MRKTRTRKERSFASLSEREKKALSLSLSLSLYVSLVCASRAKTGFSYITSFLHRVYKSPGWL